MGKPTGFLEYQRELPKYKDSKERIKDYREFVLEFNEEQINKQAARCMDCGIPFCHWGCPLGNIIPEFNDMVYKKNWEYAYMILNTTNNFPEFTGRVCPAPCEHACVAGINTEAVTIELLEKTIIEKAFKENWVKPEIPKVRTGKRIAVVGSGPAGLAAAAQLNKAGHWVVVFERANRIGGLLRYGIPDFKLEKSIIDRRIKIMRDEGIAFKPNTNVGTDISTDYLLHEFDAIVLCGGSTVPRDLPTPGRQLKGVHFAMDFLTQQNQLNAGDTIPVDEHISAKGKNVLVIGGGDTGSDCVGTANRQGAKSITQIELLEKPSEKRTQDTPWPLYANLLKTTTSHEEGCERFWAVYTKEFIGDDEGNLKAVKVVDIEWKKPEPGKRPEFVEKTETEREIPCELVLLAIGFVHPQYKGMLHELNVELDERGNVKTNNYQTNVEKVFAAGDMHRGQSLVVWAISEGREAARAVDIYLSGESTLEAKDTSLINTEDFQLTDEPETAEKNEI